MAQPPRRLYARYTCRLPFKTSDRASKEGTIVNIGMGGAYVRVRGTLTGKTLKLDVSVGSETLTLAVQVLRTTGIDPSDRTATFYGV